MALMQVVGEDTVCTVKESIADKDEDLSRDQSCEKVDFKVLLPF